ncbi:MAG: NAD(P)-dependent oxidoreductase [Actinobacteria bacterium]|nr:NAD(P)-dependent oxidoreductase [Actinomycetota bacterium]
MGSSGGAGRWGFIGLGEMGEPMAANLLCAGFDVIAFDRDAGRVRVAASRGATAASSVAEVARAAAVVSICVREAAQLDAVLDGGLVEHASAETAVLIHSTVGREACCAAAARLSARGATVVDAPVSGMRMAAEAATLAFFVGAAPDALDRVRHGLDAMGRVVVHVGDVGSGQIAKIANNLVAFGNAGILHEATELARAGGVEEHRLLEALAVGSARSWTLTNWGFLRRGWRESQPGGASAVRAIVEKDLTLAASSAATLGVEAPFAALAGRVVPGVVSEL